MGEGQTLHFQHKLVQLKTESSPIDGVSQTSIELEVKLPIYQAIGAIKTDLVKSLFPEDRVNSHSLQLLWNRTRLSETEMLGTLGVDSGALLKLMVGPITPNFIPFNGDGACIGLSVFPYTLVAENEYKEPGSLLTFEFIDPLFAKTLSRSPVDNSFSQRDRL